MSNTVFVVVESWERNGDSLDDQPHVTAFANLKDAERFVQECRAGDAIDGVLADIDREHDEHDLFIEDHCYYVKDHDSERWYEAIIIATKVK